MPPPLLPLPLPPERLKLESAPLPLFPELLPAAAAAAALVSLLLPGELSIAAAPSPRGDGNDVPPLPKPRAGRILLATSQDAM
jgi:hypothetical protein